VPKNSLNSVRILENQKTHTIFETGDEGKSFKKTGAETSKCRRIKPEGVGGPQKRGNGCGKKKSLGRVKLDLLKL